MNTVTTALTEFLLARIAEDEAACARVMKSTRTESRWMLSANPAAATVGAHPARVLAECEAKRKIVLLHDATADGPPVHVDAWTALKMALRFLAVPYSDHPDYNPDWRP